MPPSRTRLGLAAALVALAASAPAATYHVNGLAGSDDNDGVAAPFRTIGRAVQALRTSDTLVIVPMAEPYHESLPLSVGGTPEKPLVIEGGGATLSGADPAPKADWRESDGLFSIEQPTEVKFLFGPDVCYRQAKSVDAVEAEQWFWEQGVLHFRPAEGKTPADYALEMSVRVSGVLTNGASWIIVRNLTCTRFYNDGFNLHGGSAPLWFESIRGLWNGDEGFSAHENCECYVRGGEFSHNQCHGIADVNLARTHYAGITVSDNVLKGIYFIGGFHSVIDSEVGGSPVNIALQASDQSGFPAFEQHPLRVSETNLRNVAVRSQPDGVGVHVSAGAEAAIEHCLLDGGTTNLRVDEGGSAYVLNSVLTGAASAAVSADGTLSADYNLYWPGWFEIAGTCYGPEQFGTYQEGTGNDGHSWIAEHRAIGETLWSSRASRAMGNALLPAYGGMDIGPVPPGERPAEDPSILPPEAVLTESGRIRYTYDFERVNPWSRAYPDPERNAAGEAAIGTSELSDEQACSGAYSAKVTVSLPAAPPERWLVKLFTVKLPYDRPVAALRFQLLADSSGYDFRPRVRDASGECFYGEMGTLDWTGWREIAWDLEAEPPLQIAAGDGNHRQDCPPIEIVLEVFGRGGESFTLYVDDLQVELDGNP